MDDLLHLATQLANQPATPLIAPIQGRVAYVVSHGASYASNGYAIRTQGIAQALNQQGLEALCIVRPGRPWELGVAPGSVAPESVVNGVRYLHSPWLQGKAPQGEREHLEASVARFIELFRVYRPAAVLAASNWIVGLPAWVAAKRLGLPFYNEVRGFWERSRDTREAGYAQSPRGRQEAELDAFVARQARKVFTLNQPMKEELAIRDIDPAKIDIVPNAVSKLPERKPADPAIKQKLGIAPDEKVIGYVGSFSPYEGLDVLLEACTELVQGGEKLKLLLVGDSQPLIESSAANIANTGLKETPPWLIQVGRVPHEQVADYYALLDAVVIPRKPLAVCQLVPPIKAAEALAYGKRLVVSDVAPLAEYAQKHASVVAFEAGNAASLATALQESLKLPAPQPSTELLFSAHTEPMIKELKGEGSEANIQKQCEDIGLREFACAEEGYYGKPLGVVVEQVKDKFFSPSRQAAELTRLAKLSIGVENEGALYLAAEACTLDPQEYRKKWYGFLLFNAGYVTTSHKVLSSISQEYKFREVERDKMRYISGCARLLHTPPELPTSLSPTGHYPKPKRVLYVASSSRPYHYNGYTSRTHGIVKGIIEHGWEVLCVTRPGYPDDRDDRSPGEAIEYTIREQDGVQYQALKGLHRRNAPLDEYLYHSAEVLAEKARTYQASVIHAASNYEAALPALLAAKKLGVKFVYEVRGLWEFTAASRLPFWETTERFYLDKMLESFVAKNADCVATLTSALAEELVSRGANKDNVMIAANAIDPKEFQPRKRNKALASLHGLTNDNFLIGYAGSIVSYEGLDDLLVAFSILLKDYPKARLLIVGDGKALVGLKKQAKDLNIDEKIVFTGRVKAEEVPEYLSLVNVIALPRKPFRVCELVSPLKPFEAMSMEIPLVVSDVAALKEISQDGRTALLHEAGNPVDLAASLKRLITEPGLANSLVREARQLVNACHTWVQVSEGIAERYRYLGADTGDSQTRINRVEPKNAE